MSVTSCICHPPGARYLKIYAWQLEFCNGNQCAAALLSYFEFVHNWKLQQLQQAKKANDELEASGKARSQDETLLQWHTAKELEEAVMLFKRDTIDKAIDKVLVPKGAVEVRKNPNPRRWYDHTKHFLFKPNKVNAWLAKRYPPALSEPSPRISEKSEIEGIPPISEKSEIPAESPIDEKSEIGVEKSEISSEKSEISNKEVLQRRQTKKTTTTARPQMKAGPLAAADPSSSLFVVTSSKGEPSGHLSREDWLGLDAIALEFDSDGRQKEKALVCAKRRGMAFVREQADIVRSDPKIRKLAAAFEKACDSPEGWKRPKSTSEKKDKRLPRVSEPEVDPKEEARRKAEEAAAKARHELQAKMWAEASLEQRQAWVAQAPSVYRGRFAIDGPTPNPFLLAALKDTMLPEAETKPPQEAA